MINCVDEMKTCSQRKYAKLKLKTVNGILLYFESVIASRVRKYKIVIQNSILLSYYVQWKSKILKFINSVFIYSIADYVSIPFPCPQTNSDSSKDIRM